MDAELVYPGNPFGIGVRDVGVAPSVFLLDDDTQLRVISCNAAANVTVGIQGLRIDANGVPQPIVETHTPATNRVVTASTYKVGKGTLLRLTLFVTGGTPIYGQTYVLAQLIRGIAGPTQILATLIGGYITVNQALGFPGSPVKSSLEGGGYTRSIVGSTPALGAEIRETVPTNARWEVLAMGLTLQTAAAAVTRFPTVEFLNSPAQPSIGFSPSGVGANLTLELWLMQNYPPFATRAFADGTQRGAGALPLGSLLRAADFFSTLTDNLQAGDQWLAPAYLVREWLEF